MDRLIFILSISLGSVVLGYLIRRFFLDRSSHSPEGIQRFSKNLKLVSMFALNPIPIVSSFWAFQIAHSSLLFFPLLGVLCTVIGGMSALIINSLFRIPPKKAASVFTSGMFSNILTFGGLTAFVFFGIEGYALIQLFNMLITTMYYLVGFPISRQVSMGSRFRFKLSFDVLREHPYLFIPIASILVGGILNVAGIPRPEVLVKISSLLIPLISAFFGLSIGITLYIGKIGDYKREMLLISLIKFVISPLIMTTVAYVFGLPTLMGGVPFKILVIASAMPVAFNSLLPPALYGFDLDLANSAWVVTTFSFIVILPLLYVILEI